MKLNFDELITNLETDHPRRSLSSRAATTLRNSHQLTQLDGDTLTDLNDMELRMQTNKLRNVVLREQASQAGLSIAEAAAQSESNEVYSEGYPGSLQASSSRYRTLSPMSSPEHYRIDTPYQTRENSPIHTPLQTPFRTREQLDDDARLARVLQETDDEADDATLSRVLQEAENADSMLQDNDDALIARLMANFNLADESLPASSSSIMNAMTGAIRRLNLDDAESPRNKQNI